VTSAHFEIHVNGVNRATFTSLVATSSPIVGKAIVVNDSARKPFVKGIGRALAAAVGHARTPGHKSDSNRYLFNWKTTADKGATRGFRDCRFVIYDAAGSTILRYRLVRAHPGRSRSLG
jgi:hypothetical protein